MTRSGVPPETPQPYSFAASLMRCGPSAQAPNEGGKPPQTPPLNLICHLSFVTLFFGRSWRKIMSAPLQTSPRVVLDMGMGYGIPSPPALADLGKERVDGAERPSTLNQVWSCRLTAASIPQSVNEVSVDPLRGTTPPPWSRIAPLTRLLFRTRLSHVPCACVRRSGSCRDSSARESSCSRR